MSQANVKCFFVNTYRRVVTQLHPKTIPRLFQRLIVCVFAKVCKVCEYMRIHTVCVYLCICVHVCASVHLCLHVFVCVKVYTVYTVLV